MARSKRMFKLPYLYKHKALSGVTTTPDGKTAAFVATQPDAKSNKIVSEIHAWSADGGVWTVTHGGKAAQPRFSPKGDRLALLSDRDGKKMQLRVMSPRLCESRQITRFAEGVVSYCWSGDGRRLAVIAKADKTDAEKKRDKDKLDWWTVDADEPRCRLWVLNADGAGKPRQVSAADEHVGAAGWTPDGKRLVYLAAPLGTLDSQWSQSRMKIVNAQGRGRRTVCDVSGYATSGELHVSPDSTRVLICEGVTPRDLFHVVTKTVDLRSGEKQTVARRFDRRGMNAQWLSDDEVIFEAEDRTSFCLYTCAIGGAARKLPTGPGVAGQAAIAAKAGRAMFIYSEAAQPDEIHSAPLDGSEPAAALTSINRAMQRVKLVEAEAVTWRTSDGLEVEGLLYRPTKPRARRPYPLIVMPHGGPFSASANSYGGSAHLNVFTAAGYACLLPNFRGSTGYGRAFTRKIVRNWGDGPMTDIMAGVDALIRRGVADRKRLAVFGGSYGGYMTAWIVGHTRRFRCAVAVAAVINNLSMWGTTDIPNFMRHCAGGTMPSYSDAFWRDQSPLHYAHKVTTPTLVITGEVDARVPPTQSDELYRHLKAGGVETRLIRYPREPHGVSEPRHRLQYFKHALEWIDEHMKGS